MGFSRNGNIDFLKGIAIISVFLYHALGEYFPLGYLGVDVFLVIAGYFMAQYFLRVDDWNFRFCWNYIYGRLIRIYPLVIAVCGISLVIGYFMMLPDDYENLSESVVATSVFANNILAAITTKNYWDIVNFYKPLMHTWYLGVLVQLYLFVTVVIFVAQTLFKKIAKEKLLRNVFVVLGSLSLVLFVLPNFSFYQKFYYFPFRVFEFVLGGGIYVYCGELKPIYSVVLQRISKYCLLTILLAGYFLAKYVNAYALVVVVTLMTGYCLLCADEEGTQFGIGGEIISKIGTASFSVYIWHQMVIAFVGYSLFDTFEWLEFGVLVAIVAVISYLSYVYIEQGFCSYLKRCGQIKTCVWNCVCGAVIAGIGFMLFLQAGVVRDVPELDVYRSNIQRGMHGAYCDRGYKYDREFSDDNHKKKVFVIGNSFGRDFVNVLLESKYAENIELSYIHPRSKADYDRCKQRIEKADRVFYCLGPGYEDVRDWVEQYLTNEKFYVVGNKNYGKNNGLIYAKRYSGDYFKSTIVPPQDLVLLNSKHKKLYGDKYIDMMDVVTDVKGRVKVFTDDKKYISQDCRHLARAGAQFYARKLGLRIKD